MTEEQKAALDRLIAIANASTGQSEKCAEFLLAWWNPAECGRFDFRTMWGCDRAIVSDMIWVFAYIGHHNHYPDQLGYDFAPLVRKWRPDLAKPATN